MGYNFRVFETVKSKAENTALIPITPGRYLICTDTSDVYYDCLLYTSDAADE